jgi:hypothetical protein
MKTTAPRVKHEQGFRRVSGPGTVWNVDFTILSVLSCNGADSKFVRPILCLVMDAWSNCILGFSVSDKWNQFEMCKAALKCCLTMKNMMKRIGLFYDVDDWPCNRLPTAIAFDKATDLVCKADYFNDKNIDCHCFFRANTPEVKTKLETAILKIRSNGKTWHAPENRLELVTMSKAELTKAIVLGIIEWNHSPATIGEWSRNPAAIRLEKFDRLSLFKMKGQNAKKACKAKKN